jgi:hypothetical protein
MSEVLVERGAAAGPIATPRELLPYAILAATLLSLVVYFVGAEEGVATLIGGGSVHEFFHDARHLLGFPCH